LKACWKIPASTGASSIAATREMDGESQRLGAGRDVGYQLPDALEKFSQSFLAERTKAGGEPPVHPLFSAVESLLASR
jgi:hypothetical protein